MGPGLLYIRDTEGTTQHLMRLLTCFGVLLSIAHIGKLTRSCKSQTQHNFCHAGESQSVAHKEGLNLIKQEASASPPSQGSVSESMDIGNSDAESPADQAARPIDHMWSPQYSPAKLAELVPVRHSPAPNNFRHSGSSAVAQSHPQHGAPDTSRSVEPQGPVKHLHSHPGSAHQTPNAQAMHQHQMQARFPAGGHLFPDVGHDHSHPPTDHACSPSNQLRGVSERPPSPPPPPPNPMHNRPYSPTYALDAAKSQHHSMPAPREQSLQPVHHWQANQSRDEQPMMSHHHREVAYSTAGPQHAAPGQDANQSEQLLKQSHQLPYSPTRPDTHSLSHQQLRPVQHSTHLQLNSLSQYGSFPSGGWRHPSEPPQMHPHTHSAYDAPHASDGQAHWQGHLEQGKSTQGLGPRQVDHAGPMHAPYASQHLVHDLSPRELPAALWPQEPHPYPHHGHDLGVPIKPEPDVASALNPTVQPVDHNIYHASSNLQSEPQPQAATVLSPELAAALAAGVFRQTQATSDQQTAKQHEHQPAQPDMRPQQLSGRDVASALPPELSAALASGQLNFQLGRSDAVSHSQQARQHDYEPRQAPVQPEQAPLQPVQTPFQRDQAPFQHEQAAYQPEQAAYQPERASSQPKSAAAYGPEQAASQPKPVAAHQPEQAAYQSGQAAHRPERAAFQSGRAVHQPEQAANRFGQAAYQPQHPQASHWAMERPHTSADPAGLLQRQHHSQLPVSVADSHQESWQTCHNAAFGGEPPLQMTMNSPTLGTHHHAAASHHDFAMGPGPLPASPSGFQQSAFDQHPQRAQHAPQHGQHVPEQAQHVSRQVQHVPQQPQHVPPLAQHLPHQAQQVPQQAQRVSQQAQHVPQQAQHVPQQAQYLPQQALRAPQQAQHEPQQAQHVPEHAQHVLQQAQHAPQQAQHIPQQEQHLPQQGQQVLQPDNHAIWQPHIVSRSRPFEGAARSGFMAPESAQHGPRDHDIQRHAGYAEHSVRHPQPEDRAEQKWQARGAHDGQCFPPVLVHCVFLET